MPVLIDMDMPTSCFDCNLMEPVDEDRTYCNARGYRRLSEDRTVKVSRPDWCPLVATDEDFIKLKEGEK